MSCEIVGKQIKTWNGHRGMVLDTVNGFDVIECKTCRFKHVIPIPTQEELEAVYRNDYYTTEKPLYLERAREDLDWWNIVYNDRYDTFEVNLPKDRRRILDIGSGPGFFLKHGQNRGWAVKGIEPSKQAAEHARGLGISITEAFFSENIAGTLGKFDAIHLSEVLEHIPDPVALLNLAKSCLSTNSLICVVVPNDYNPFQIALRSACGYDPWWVAPPHHLNFFDVFSLKDLLKSTGFQVFAEEATFPIDAFLLMGENYTRNDTLGRKCHYMRKSFELNLEMSGFGSLRRELYRKIASLGIGREIVIYAKKA